MPGRAECIQNSDQVFQSPLVGCSFVKVKFDCSNALGGGGHRKRCLISRERLPRPYVNRLCHHHQGRNALSLQKLMNGGRRIASMRRRAYIRVVCGRDIRPSAATTGSKVWRVCYWKYICGRTALMAGVNAYEAIVLALYLTQWSDIN